MTHKLGCEPCSFPGNRRLFKARTSGWSLLHRVHYVYLSLQWAAQDHQLHAFSPRGYSPAGFAEEKAEGKRRAQGNIAGDACDKSSCPVTPPGASICLIKHCQVQCATLLTTGLISTRNVIPGTSYKKERNTCTCKSLA